ncbi:MAG TPA: hypothetical protein VFH53_08550 [Phycisphaerae bacterium]|nr:hypothetical protein [Phycisphaerae bacterium]
MRTQALPNLRDLVLEAAQHQTDVERIVAAVWARIRKDGKLRRSLERTAFRLAIRVTVHDVQAVQRTGTKRNGAAPPPVNRCTRGPDTIRATSLAVATAVFLDTWVVGGCRLGDLYGADLKPLAARERQQAAGHGRAARFYAALTRKVPGDEKVRDRVTSDQAAAIWKAICDKNE